MKKNKPTHKYLQNLISILLLIFVNTFLSIAQYTLTSDDVVVEEGVITSCSYNFVQKNIVIPSTLDGQTVNGIAGSYYSGGGIFYHKGITSITLPNTLENIGDYSFYDNEIVNLILPEGVTSIGNYSFYSNNITALDLGSCNMLTTIGNYAFYANKLADLDLSGCSSLSSIGNYAFYNNVIAALDLSSSTALKTIKSYAFGSNELVSIDLSNCTALTQIESYAFWGNSMTNFLLPEVTYNTSTYTTWIDGKGNNYTSGSTNVTDFSTFYVPLIPYTLTNDDVIVDEGEITSCSYDFELKNIIIPSTLDGQTITGIKGISYNSGGVFYNRGITSVILPTTLENIGAYAFYENKIISLIIPEGITSIGNYAFYLNAISDLDLSTCAELTTIGNYAFYANKITDLDLNGCSSLSSIGSYAFYNNDIAALDLSATLQTIGNNAFSNNELASIDLSNCTALLKIENQAFWGNSLISFLLPEVTYNASTYTTWIDGNGKNYTSGLTDVTDFSTFYVPLIHYTLTNNDVIVEDGIITSCSYDFELKNIIIPSTLDGQTVTGIKDATYSSGGIFYNKGITSVTLPSTLENIGDYSFYDNDIISVIIPAGVSSIGNYAFYLNTISDLDLSTCAELTTIGNYAFYANKITDLDLSVCILLTFIGNQAFYSNDIATLDLSTNVALKTIGEYAFSYNELASIDLSNCTALTKIEKNAFWNNSIASFLLPEVTYNTTTYTTWIDGNGKSYTSGLTDATNFSTFYVPVIPYTLTNDDVVVEDGEITSCSYDFELKNIIIPSTLDGQTVTGIKDATYSSGGIFYNKGITSITLPATLENIGAYSFYDNEIFLLTIPGSVASIGNNAFYSNNISELDIAACNVLATIGNYAFYSNKITELDLSGCTSLSSIGSYAYYSNDIATLDLSLNNALKSIGSYAFGYNELASVELSNCTALVKIDKYAFWNNSLTSFILPEPAIPGCILNYWEDGEENQYISGETVTVLSTEYNANTIQFPQNNFYAEYSNSSQTVSAGLDFNCPNKGFEVTNITFSNTSFVNSQTIPLTVLAGDTSFFVSYNLGATESEIYNTNYDIVYSYNGQTKTYSDSLYVAVILEDSSELSYIGKQAIEAYHASIDSNEIATENNKGVIYRLLGYSDEAEEIFNETVNKALENFYGFTGIKMNQGVVQSDKDSSVNAMTNYSEVLTDLSGEEATSSIAPRVYYNQAWEYYFMGEYADARTKALATIEHQKSNDYLKSKAYVLLGVNDAAQEDTVTAIENFKIAMEIAPESFIADMAKENIALLYNADSYEYIAICQGENYNDWVETGEYTRTVESHNGGDSTVLTFLTVNPTYEQSKDTSICEGETYKDWTTTGQYTENLSTTLGCDSIIITNLTVNPIYNLTFDTTICEGNSFNGWETTGMYTQNLISTQGCDSIVNFNLFVNSSYYIEKDTSICKGESYNGHTNPGDYTETFSSVLGCDSIVTTTLYVSPSYNFTINTTICEGEDYNGWTSAGEYTQNFVSTYGCDSIVTTNLFVAPTYRVTIDTSIFNGENYNGWTTAGEYTQNLVSSQGCDSVLTINLSVGIDMETKDLFSIYPNPNDGLFKLTYDKSTVGDIRIEIFNSLGKLVYSEKMDKDIGEHEVNIKQLSKGLYFVIMQAGEKKMRRKIIIQ